MRRDAVTGHSGLRLPQTAVTAMPATAACCHRNGGRPLAQRRTEARRHGQDHRQGSQGEELQSGEILATTVTDIGWTPLFPGAAAAVTDVGAPPSHVAIVARELGSRPSSVGCGNATARIHLRDRIRVDGERGTVDILRSRGRAGCTTTGIARSIVPRAAIFLL